MTQKEVVARTIWGEARGEPFDGKFGVASVIWNRAKGDPSKLSGVCLKRKQFSCWDDGTLEAEEIDKKSAAWLECWMLASAMFYPVVGKFMPVFDATHYYAPREGKPEPYWVPSMTFVKKIGNHLFYKGV